MKSLRRGSSLTTNNQQTAIAGANVMSLALDTTLENDVDLSNAGLETVSPMATTASPLAAALWDGRIPLAGMTLIAGAPSSGKGFVTCRMVAQVTNGERGPFDQGGAARRMPADVLIVADRLTHSSLVSRLAAAGADLSRVLSLAPEIHESMDLESIASALALRPGCQMLVVDPVVVGFLGGALDEAGLETMRDLADFAAEHRLALIAVVRVRQDRAGWKRELDALCRCGLGSVMCVVRERADPARRFLLPARCVEANDSQSLAFRIRAAPDSPRGTAARVEWIVEPLKTEAAQVRAGIFPLQADDGDSAKNWLRDKLAKGPVYVKDLEVMAIREHRSWISIRRAKDELPIALRRVTIHGATRSNWELCGEPERLAQLVHDRNALADPSLEKEAPSQAIPPVAPALAQVAQLAQLAHTRLGAHDTRTFDETKNTRM